MHSEEDANLESFKQAIRVAMETRSLSEFDELIMENATFCGTDHAAARRVVFSHTELEFIIELLESPELHAMPDPSPLIARIHADWAGFSEEQQTRILNHIECAYGKYGTWYTWFLMTEILGECDFVERAYDIAVRLLATSDGVGRSLLPHAFEHLSEAELVRAKAMSQLEGGLTDPSTDYREECALSLTRIANKNAYRNAKLGGL